MFAVNIFYPSNLKIWLTVTDMSAGSQAFLNANYKCNKFWLNNTVIVINGNLASYKNGQ